MQKKINEIRGSMRRGDYSEALSHLSSIYSSLYSEKINLCRLYPNKNFSQIINSDCLRIKKWCTAFHMIDGACEKTIEIIENIVKKEAHMFVNVEGEDLFAKMITRRNHCRNFANRKVLPPRKES